MAGEETINTGNIKPEYNAATTGMNMDNTVNQIPKGMLTYALNAGVENFDANSVNYQNEPGNEFCLQFPTGYVLIGEHFINEKNKHVFFITNPNTGDSEIGYMDNNDCIYRTYVNAKCLNFDIKHPIHKIVHRITNCETEIYWTDGFNSRRYLDLENIPYKIKYGSSFCDPEYTTELDCNRLKVQPNFNIPDMLIVDVLNGGNLVAGTYQFAIQYADATGNPFTSYYSITNPTPIADPQLVTPNFNYQVGKSIVVSISNLDTTGIFEYYNLAVIKTVNDISSVELVGTYFIDSPSKNITYTGQNQTNIRLSISDIFEKYPYYDVAQDLTAVQDILVWDNLTSIDRINYQKIANQITLQWETWRIPATENYSDELNATNLRGYMRDEVYAFEIVFILRNGKQTDGFHIPGRVRSHQDNQFPDISELNDDFIGNPTYYQGGVGYSPYWKIYNTASVTGFSPGYSPAIDYKGPYQYGEFAYWESTETYPCNVEVWGDLVNQPIRHHKFPDVLVSPIFESKIFAGSTGMVMGNDAVFPIGVRVDPTQIIALINQSSLTDDQKDEIVAFKIVRGNRGTNKSVIAKGILRNVGKYEREEETFFYPNYPYNDIRPDPFLLEKNNAYLDECITYFVQVQAEGDLEYTDCNTNKRTRKTNLPVGPAFEICSTSKPIMLSGKASIGFASHDRYLVLPVIGIAPVVGVWWQGFRFRYEDYIDGFQERWLSGFPGSNPFTSNYYYYVDVVAGTQPIRLDDSPGSMKLVYIGRTEGTLKCGIESPLPPIADDEDAKYRHVFNSPETSFGQPFLGKILKLENVIFGAGKAHHVEVDDNAKYKLLTKEAQLDALGASDALADETNPWSATAMFAAYQAYLTIYTNGITRKNYAYSYNSIADYNYSNIINNGLGVKQRNLDIAQYVIPGVQSVSDVHNLNNWNRESSVYLRTDLDKPALPFPSKTPSIGPGGASIVSDESRFTISERDNCQSPAKETDITVVSYYASIKNDAINQWGQMYSYETVDTGYQKNINPVNQSLSETVFGGDTFISRFAFKTKLPFFIDNRVNAPDDSDIFYDEIGNVAYPKYWHSARSILSNYNARGSVVLYNIVSYKAHNFDCPNSQEPRDNNPNRTYYDGYFYMFAYGIPNFYCETAYNTDLRQAFNIKEGDFWPHVSTGIPDDWVQESFVPIAQDNTYYYNVTFSKQNKENFFTHLPEDWEERICFTNYPFRAIYSDSDEWLVYRAVSYFDFPQNYGNLVSLDGIENKKILARFENKSLLYNNLLTINTSNPQAAYIGNSNLFAGAPPIDFAETDLGYVGSQNKMLLKIPQGQVTVDAKRGQVFLLAGNQATDISAFGSGMNRWFTDHLAFEILKHFPNADIDNHFNGTGLHGVYDSKYDRVILTKLDYVPVSDDVKYDPETNEFYVEEIIPIPTTTSTSSTTTTTTTVDCGNCIYLSIISTALPASWSALTCNFVPVGGSFTSVGQSIAIDQCICENTLVLINAETKEINPCTTTTTTTVISCLCYTITATSFCTATWTNCDGSPGFSNFGEASTISICAQENSLEITGLAPLCTSDIVTNGPCTTEIECIPTTTTTTTVPSNEWVIMNNNGATSGSAICFLGIGGPTVYSDIPTFTSGMTFYTNSGLTIAYNGQNWYHKIFHPSTGISYYAKIKPDGTIAGLPDTSGPC